MRREARWGDLLTQFVENMTQPRATRSLSLCTPLFVSLSLSFFFCHSSRLVSFVVHPSSFRAHLPSASLSLSLSRRPCPYLRSERSSVFLGGGVCVSLFLSLSFSFPSFTLPQPPVPPPVHTSRKVAAADGSFSLSRRSLSPSLAHSHFLSSSHASAPPSPPSTTATSFLRLIYSQSSTLALLPVHTSDQTERSCCNTARVHTFTRAEACSCARARARADECTPRQSVACTVVVVIVVVIASYAPSFEISRRIQRCYNVRAIEFPTNGACSPKEQARIREVVAFGCTREYNNNNNAIE